MSQPATETTAPASKAAIARPAQYLTFRLGEQEYAIDILQVTEIKGHMPITALPHSASYVRGAVNLRGVIIPVYDLRQRFAQGVTDYHRFSVIIIVTVGQRQVGLIVDAVSDVVDLRPDQVEPPPEVGDDVGFVQALGRIDQRILVLLDLNKVVA